MGGRYSTALLLGALAAAPAGIAFIAANFWPTSGWMQPNDFYFGSDFVNYWTGGRLALLGRLSELYDLAAYNQVLRAWFSPDILLLNFSYPPHALLGLVPLSLLPYFIALLLWSVLGAVGFSAVALGRQRLADDWALIAAFVLAPVLWVNLVFGQMGLLLAVLFVGALRALPTRPVLAGVLIGVLTIKPQLGILLALFLLATGSWRAMLVAAATALVLIGLSLVAFGVEPWRAYLTETLPFQWRFVEQMNGFYRFQMATPYTAVWFLGASTQTALALQTAVSATIAVTALLVARSAAAWPLKCAVIACGSVLMVPYVLAYDLAVPYAALIWHLREDHPVASTGGVALVGLLWALPFALGIAAQIYGVPLLPLVLLAAYVWLVSQALNVDVLRHARTAFAATRAAAR